MVSPQADCRIGSTSEIDDGVTEIPFSNSDDKVNVPSHPSPDGEDIPIDFVDMVHQCSSSDALRGLIDELDDVVRRNSLPPRELAKVFFALAKAHSALEDYDGLASHLIKAASYCRESLQVAENLLLEHSRGTVEDDAQGLLTNLNRRLGIY